MKFKSFSAQGTIEYLVIMAVVVVISLIVVALFINVSSSPSQQISDSSSKIGEVAVGGISIVESVIDPNGDSLILLSNNSSDAITLKKISVGNVDNNYDNYISGVNSVSISLSGISSSCPCVTGQKSARCGFVIEYLTANGLTKRESRTVNVVCVSDSVSNDSKLIEPIVDVLELGTLEYPWIVNDCLELQDMNSNLDGNYILGNNIDCYSATREGGALYNGGMGFSPIGSDNISLENSFRGSLDGKGYLITGLYINKTSSNAGLFASAYGNNVVIKNIGLVNVDITGSNYSGSLVGLNSSNSITNNYVTGEIKGSGGNLGGLIGRNLAGLITNNYTSLSVIGTGDTYVGGLVGLNNGVIENNYVGGNISGVYLTGGLVGLNLFSTAIVKNNFVVGSVGTQGEVGSIIWENTLGILGNNYWDISLTGRANCLYNRDVNCFSTNNNPSWYYSSINAPLSSWTWGVDGNWIERDNNYPILSWQN